MEDKNFQQQIDNSQNSGGGKTFFKHLGIYVLALALATLTVIVLNF
jgi:hypothetical protein